MSLLKWLFGLVLATSLHVLGVRLLPQMPLLLDPFLIFVVYQSLEREPGWALVQGGLVGLAQDALSGGLYGIHGFADTVVAYVAVRLQQRLVIQQTSQVALLFALAAALQLAVIALLYFWLVARPELPPPLAAVKLLTAGAIGAGLRLLRTRIMARWQERSLQRRQRIGIKWPV